MSLVSIITPTYNSEEFISKTIQSIINQTYTKWELIITDDCSTDSTWNILESFANNHNRIHIYRLKTNSGAGIARNNSIAKANGRFIAFCDSDDQWFPQKLEKQVKYMLDHNTHFSYSSYLVQDENQKIIGKINAPQIISYQKILRNNYVGCLTAIYDSQELGKLFMSDTRKRQDWILWIHILEKLHEVKGIDEPLAIYTKRENSISRNKLDLLKHNWRLYYNTLNFNKYKASWYFIQFLYFYAKKKIFN